jgi:hypothetical protein
LKPLRLENVSEWKFLFGASKRKISKSFPSSVKIKEEEKIAEKISFICDKWTKRFKIMSRTACSKKISIYKGFGACFPFSALFLLRDEREKKI